MGEDGAPCVPMNRPSDAARVLYVGDEHCVALLGGVLVFVIRDDPKPNIIAEQRRWMALMQENSPEGSAFIAILRADTPPPSEAARVLIKRTLAEFGQVAKAGAMVIEGKGFVAATFRSVLSMLMLAIRPDYPFRIFDDVGEGCTWLLGYVGKSGRVPPHRLIAAFEDLKHRYRNGELTIST